MPGRTRLREVKLTLPMAPDMEVVASQAASSLAAFIGMSPDRVDEVRLAVVEACINATEHSHSPDRKIYQKFTVEDDKIIITISNRGLRLADRKAPEIAPDEGRRGWGLKLMKTLMDEVKFEQTDDGTRISMTKYLKNG